MDLFLEGSIQKCTSLSSTGGSRKESGSYFRTRSQPGGLNLSSDTLRTVVGWAAPIWLSLLWKSFNLWSIDILWLPSLCTHRSSLTDKPGILLSSSGCAEGKKPLGQALACHPWLLSLSPYKVPAVFSVTGQRTMFIRLGSPSTGRPCKPGSPL